MSTPPTRAGVSSDALRQRNLSAVLGLVAHRGPISRADLARETGLNRSTVGALVAELTNFGFVGETYPTASQGMGRPSSMVAVNDRVVAVAVQLRRDRVTVALVGLGGQLHQSITLPHDHAPSSAGVVATTSAVIAGLRQDVTGTVRVVGIGVGLPGRVRQSDGLVVTAPALGWAEEPFAAELAAATSLPVLIAGSAQLAVTAEVRFGGWGSPRDVLFLTSDDDETSGGIVCAGEPIRGSEGFAADLGHLTVVSGGAPCTCGGRGCLMAELGPMPATLRAPRPAEPTLADLDIADRTEVRRRLDLTAVAVVNAVRVLDPALVVLGGELGFLHGLQPQVVEAALGLVRPEGNPPRVVRAGTDLEHVVLGAGELAFSELLQDPGTAASRLDQLAEDSKHWSRQRLNPAVFHRLRE